MFNSVSSGRSRSQQLTLLCIAVFGLLVVLISSNRLLQWRSQDFQTTISPDAPSTTCSITGEDVWAKPNNTRVIGLVFFGRRDRVQILNCYLQRNLVLNGGILDEIQFVENTENVEDLEYLNRLVSDYPGYRKLRLDDHSYEKAYENAWSKMEPGAIYVKIDDDVVWLPDDTIPHMVRTKLEHPEFAVVSANMINSPLMGWLHYHMGAVHPYLPERIDLEDVPTIAGESKRLTAVSGRRVPWRSSDHPPWQGPDDFVFDHKGEPPSDPHRWLRVSTAGGTVAPALERTPIKDSEYNTWGNSLESWAIATQQHYSLLENIEKNQLHLYKLGFPNSTWTTNYERLSINLIAVDSTEILSHLPMDTVDEEWLTVTLPKRLGKSVVVATHALAAHFSFAFQKKVATTDLISRYLDYSREIICPGEG